MAVPQRVLVAIDGSSPALRAGALAVDLAASWDARVRAVAVLAKERGTRLMAKRDPEAMSATERRRATFDHALSHLVRIGAEVGVTVEPALLERPESEAYESILQEAERWSADVLVMGRTSHRGIGRALLGSQTEHVLEFATIPVIVVPATPGS